MESADPELLRNTRQRRWQTMAAWGALWLLGLLGIARPLPQLRQESLPLASASAAGFPGLAATPTQRLRPAAQLAPAWSELSTMPSPEKKAAPKAAVTAQPLIVEKSANRELSIALRQSAARWQGLPSSTREALDRLLNQTHGIKRIKLSPTGWRNVGAQALAAYTTEVRGQESLAAAVIVDENGLCECPRLGTSGLGTGNSLVVALAGHFRRQEAKSDQLSALGEVVEYIRGKVGMVPVEISGRSVEWRLFPRDQVLAQLNEPLRVKTEASSQPSLREVLDGPAQ